MLGGIPRILGTTRRLVVSSPRLVLSSPRLVTSTPRLVTSILRLVTSILRLVTSIPRLVTGTPRLVVTTSPLVAGPPCKNGQCREYVGAFSRHSQITRRIVSASTGFGTRSQMPISSSRFTSASLSSPEMTITRGSR